MADSRTRAYSIGEHGPVALRIMHDRRVRTGILALAALMIATACSPAGSGTDDTGDGPFVVARTGGVEQLDPAKATAFQTVHTLGLVYDTLLDTDDNGELAPGLAKEWEVSDGGTTVTFTLRRGVTFHEGATFTAKDAKATLQRLLDEKTGSVVRSYLLSIESIETPGKYTLVLQLKRPDAALLTALTYVGTSMLDSGDIQAGTVARDPNGTGPFRWVSWKQGRRVTLAANAGYWDGVPKLSKVQLRVIPEESSIVSGMKAGSFDLGVISDPGVVRNIDGSSNSGVQVMEQATLSYHTLMLNSRRGPLGKLKVRQAIACAIDRNQVVETAYFGHGKVTGPITSPAYEYDPTAGLPCDPPDRQKAKSLLAEAGYADGFTLDTIVMVGQYSTATNVAQSLQAQLKKIGVRLQLKQQQTNVYVDNWLAADFDAAVALNGGSYDPYLLYNRYFTEKGSLTKPAGFSSETLDRLLRKGNATTDMAERRRIFGKLQREMLRLSPWIWLLRNPVYYLAGENVRGFEPTPTQSLEHLTSTRLVESES